MIPNGLHFLVHHSIGECGCSNDENGFKHSAWIDWSLVVDFDSHSDIGRASIHCPPIPPANRFQQNSSTRETE